MIRSTNVDRSDWILLALFAAKEHRLTALKLQKSLFLLGARRSREVGKKYYVFRPYHYGPFDADIYHDTDRLQSAGLIELDLSSGQQLRQFVLTDRGERTAKTLATRRSKKGLEYLNQVVRWVQPLSFNALVRAIYDEFPDMRSNSIFDDS